jgi:hypothetical protein
MSLVMDSLRLEYQKRLFIFMVEFCMPIFSKLWHLSILGPSFRQNSDIRLERADKQGKKEEWES